MVKITTFYKSLVTWVDPLLWIAAVFIGTASFFTLSHWPALSIYIDVAIGLVATIFILFLLGWTQQGRAFLKFSKEAQVEMKKVHWPTRQETLQTTVMVVVMVVVVGLFLWGSDGFLMWGIDKLTGQ